MSCYRCLSECEKKEIVIEMLKSLLPGETSMAPVAPAVPVVQPVLSPCLRDGSVYDPAMQIACDETIVPVVMITSKEVPGHFQKILLSAEKGSNILELNECTNTWEPAKIYGNLPILIPDGVHCISDGKEMILGHTKSAPLGYFILPHGTRLVHSNGGKETTTLDHIIRFIPHTKFILEPETLINYGGNNDEKSFKRREITIDFDFF
jgi:hypothetical protein